MKKTLALIILILTALTAVPYVSVMGHTPPSPTYSYDVTTDHYGIDAILGETVTALATTNNSAVNFVRLYWKNALSQIIGYNETNNAALIPNSTGIWTVEAKFYDKYWWYWDWVYDFKGSAITSFNVINPPPPTYPITVTITYPEPTTYTTGTVPVSLSATTNGTLNEIWFNVDEGANSTYTGETTLTLTDGNYVLYAYANNIEGYSDAATVEFTVCIPTPTPNPSPSPTPTPSPSPTPSATPTPPTPTPQPITLGQGITRGWWSIVAPNQAVNLYYDSATDHYSAMITPPYTVNPQTLQTYGLVDLWAGFINWLDDNGFI